MQATYVLQCGPVLQKARPFWSKRIRFQRTDPFADPFGPVCGSASPAQRALLKRSVLVVCSRSSGGVFDFASERVLEGVAEPECCEPPGRGCRSIAYFPRRWTLIIFAFVGMSNGNSKFRSSNVEMPPVRIQLSRSITATAPTSQLP